MQTIGAKIAKDLLCYIFVGGFFSFVCLFRPGRKFLCAVSAVLVDSEKEAVQFGFNGE